MWCFNVFCISNHKHRNVLIIVLRRVLEGVLRGDLRGVVTSVVTSVLRGVLISVLSLGLRAVQKRRCVGRLPNHENTEITCVFQCFLHFKIQQH